MDIREAVQDDANKFIALVKELFKEYFNQLNHWPLSDGLIVSVEDYTITVEPFSVVIHDDNIAHTII